MNCRQKRENFHRNTQYTHRPPSHMENHEVYLFILSYEHVIISYLIFCPLHNPF